VGHDTARRLWVYPREAYAVTAFAIVLPFRRTSPLYVPRRDLVIPASDSLSLSVTVVESDDPSALALQLLGGTGFPLLALKIWRETGHARHTWDYGAWWDGWGEGEVLWSGTAQVGADAGEFVLFIPASALTQLPRRCKWAVQLGWDELSSDILAMGTMNVLHGGSFSMPIAPVGDILVDGDLNPLVDDDGNLILDGSGFPQGTGAPPPVITPPPVIIPPPPDTYIPSLNFSDARNAVLTLLGW
jgi:hypothetical protein